MKRYVINGDKPLSGSIAISGSKNVAVKAVIAACLTEDPITLTNVPQISDINALIEVIQSIGGNVQHDKHTVTIQVKDISNATISLAEGARVRTSSMFLAPLLARKHHAKVPNPQGCRLGARPIERHIEGLEKMGAKIEYHSNDGYYHATTDGLQGVEYTFEKNTHTGTETLIMAAVLAKGTTTLNNAAEEHEIDDLIQLLNKMGAKITREKDRKIVIEGVEKLHGASHEIVPDSNEFVTFASLALATGAKIGIQGYKLATVDVFLKEVEKIGGRWEEKDGQVFFSAPNNINSTEVTTAPEPGFKTDWQGPWAVMMTQANGTSTIHETIYENRFGYVSELKKMGAQIEYFQPDLEDPQKVYNFNYDKNQEYKQAIRIKGPSKLHNAVLNITDLRAGATLVIASLLSPGESLVSGIEHIERGYENFDQRLRDIGAEIKVIDE